MEITLLIMEKSWNCVFLISVGTLSDLDPSNSNNLKYLLTKIQLVVTLTSTQHNLSSGFQEKRGSNLSPQLEIG